MQRKTTKLLDDIRDAASFIHDVTIDKSLNDYRKDRLLRQAVERNFEIIGEAAGRVARDDPQTAVKIDQISEIIAFRNVLIHGYDLIDDSQVWNVIGNDIPKLLQQVIRLIEGFESL